MRSEVSEDLVVELVVPELPLTIRVLRLREEPAAALWNDRRSLDELV